MKTLTPTRGLATVRREIDRLFDRLWDRNELAILDFDSPFPRVDVVETDESLIVKLDVPGLEVKDVHVAVRDNALTIRGEKRNETEEKEERHYRMERTYGAFRRRIALPVSVDATNVKATVRNGVLTVTLPKVEQAQDREVPVLVE